VDGHLALEGYLVSAQSLGRGGGCNVGILIAPSASAFTTSAPSALTAASGFAASSFGLV
jgi:hypothetical protein